MPRHTLPIPTTLFRRSASYALAGVTLQWHARVKMPLVTLAAKSGISPEPAWHRKPARAAWNHWATMVHSPPETHKLPPPTRHIPAATALTWATDSAGTQNSSAPAPAETSRDGVPPETLDSTEYGKLNRLFRPVFDFRRKHPSNFIFAHVNVNSLRHKFASLHEVLSKNCLDYFAISETKLDGSFPDAQFNVNDFNILREDNTAASGGLMVYIRSDIPHRRLTDT